MCDGALPSGLMPPAPDPNTRFPSPLKHRAWSAIVASFHLPLFFLLSISKIVRSDVG